MSQATSPKLREKREALVREHMDSENRHEFDDTLATFAHLRYELVATGEVHDGAEEVMRYFTDSRTAFGPAQRAAGAPPRRRRGAGRGRRARHHLGRLGGLPPTGRSCELPILAIFAFEEKASSASGSISTPTRCCASSGSRATRSASPAGSARWSATR